MEEYAREPCPWRIVDDCGGAFAMGLAGGSIFHAYRGYKGTHRLVDMVKSMKVGAPRTGGQFAMWGVTFSSVDCLLVKMRKKEDALNSIISGGVTGALLTVRAGVPTMVGSAIVGAVLLGLIEGVGVLITRVTADQFKIRNPGFEEPTGLPPKQPSSSSPSSGGALPFGGPQMNFGAT